ALIAAEVNAPWREMVKHHGIGSAGHAYDGADWGSSRGRREHSAGAAGAVLAAVGGGDPGGIDGRLGGGSYVHGDRAKSLCTVRQQSVAGVDGECGKDSDIAGWGSAGSEDGGAAEVGAGGSSVDSRTAGGAGEGRNFGIGRAPGERRIGEGDTQDVDRGGRDGYAAAVIYGDGVSGLALAPDLEAYVLQEAGRVRKWTAGSSGDAGKELGDPRGLGGGLNLVGQKCGHGSGCGDNSAIARQPVHGADGVGDVHVVAVGDPLELPGLTLGKAVIWGRLGLCL